MAGLVGFTAYRGSALDGDSKAYVEQAVVDIGRNWDRAELLRRASPVLLQRASGEQVAALFQQLARFGGLRRYDGAKGQATVVVAIGRGSTVRAHYEASATFENGPARFRIDLSNQDERWMIDGFFVDGAPVSRDL